MQIEITEKELEIFYIGLMLGRELDVVQEWQTDDAVGFGDFEGLNIVFSKRLLSLDFGYIDNRVNHFASLGIVHEARREVKEWLGGESND